MTNFEIAYDTSLEEIYDRIKMQMWMNEELQLQPKTIRNSIIKTYKDLFRQSSTI
ncbi:MAG: hypothetical protein ACFFAO_08950 [Candidatus Hermodarchaeota archaeon]